MRSSRLRIPSVHETPQSGESLAKAFNFSCGIDDQAGGKARLSSTGGYDDRIPVDSGRDAEAAIAGQYASIERLNGMGVHGSILGLSFEQARHGLRDAGVEPGSSDAKSDSLPRSDRIEREFAAAWDGAAGDHRESRSRRRPAGAL